MEKITVGTIESVSLQYWLKVNTKAVRRHAMDGATFPAIIRVRYSVDGKDYVKRKWTAPALHPPLEGQKVRVFYREDRPSKCRIELR